MKNTMIFFPTAGPCRKRYIAAWMMHLPQQRRIYVKEETCVLRCAAESYLESGPLDFVQLYVALSREAGFVFD